MSILFYLGTIMVFFLSWFSPANALTVSTEQEAAKTLSIHYTINSQHVISGTIINKSPHAIRDVRVASRIPLAVGEGI